MRHGGTQPSLHLRAAGSFFNFLKRLFELRRRHSVEKARQKGGEHIRQDDAPQPIAMERHAADVIVTDPGKVAEYVAGFDVAEDQPRIAFVGDTAFKLDIDTLQFQGSPGVVKYRQFEKRPIRKRPTPSSEVGVPSH